jgi:ubiquinone/menaquinone biosynthesis C-methylase UbiE
MRVAGPVAEGATFVDIPVAASKIHHPRVLDAGAGTGALTRRLAASEPTIHPVLVDLSPAMLAEAADLYEPRAVATLTSLPTPF